MKRAVVFAGGGVAGIAWEIGILRGIQDLEPELYAGLVAADVIVGTSAGAAVAAQITSRTPLGDLYDAQLSEATSELEVDFDLENLMARFAEARAGATTAEDMRRRMGALALATRTVDESTRRAAIAARLPVHSWPDQALLVTAVNAETGELMVFTRASGVALVDAVAASCALPGVWPPETVGGHRYIDGGIRSVTNADLATGCDRVLVVTPSLAGAPQLSGSLEEELELLKPAEALVIYADTASREAFGSNPLSPSTRGPSARAGRVVGKSRAAELAVFWS